MILSTKLRDRILATPCTNYDTPGKNVKSGVLFIAYYLVRYRVEGNCFATLIQNIINKNSRQIVDECQQYLDLYSQGIKPAYSTDIDYL